jgi:hypothetical protein
MCYLMLCVEDREKRARQIPALRRVKEYMPVTSPLGCSGECFYYDYRKANRLPGGLWYKRGA